MDERKTYGQFCGLARSLDRVGDRWTLLIVRELLIGPRTFRELGSALPGLAPGLLVDRLRRLEDEGLVRRNEAPPRSKAVSYALTDVGQGLRPVVFEFIRWGARWMASGPGEDRVDPRWAALALSALLEGPVPAHHHGSVHLDLDGEQVTVELESGRRRVRPGRAERADARVIATLPAALAVASGLATSPEPALTIEGDLRLARAALTPVLDNAPAGA